MKIKFFDTAISNPHGIAYFELKKELNRLRIQEKAQIKAIKPILTYGQDVMVAIYYEKPANVKQKLFYADTVENEQEINNFMKAHDVIKVEHFGADCDDITTIVTYREYEDESVGD